MLTPMLATIGSASVDNFGGRVRAIWDQFFTLSRKYWLLYVAVLLVEDRAQNWANDQIDSFAPAAVRDIVAAPFLLIAGVTTAILLLAYVETRSSANKSLDDPLSEMSPEDRADLLELAAQEQRRLIAREDQEARTMKKLEADYAQAEKERVLWVNTAAERATEIASLKPKAEWADSVINAERSRAPLVEVVNAALWNLEMLKADDPYFEIGYSFRYIGNLQLVIGDPPPSGKLSLDGESFAREPEIMIDWKLPLPFDRTGPTGGILRFRQYVTPARAEKLRVRLQLDREEFRGREGEVEFITRDLRIATRLISFDGHILREGFLLGEYLTLRYAIKD